MEKGVVVGERFEEEKGDRKKASRSRRSPVTRDLCPLSNCETNTFKGVNLVWKIFVLVSCQKVLKRLYSLALSPMVEQPTKS